MDIANAALVGCGMLAGAGVAWGAMSNRLLTVEKELDRVRKSLHDAREEFGNRLTALEVAEEKRKKDA